MPSTAAQLLAGIETRRERLTQQPARPTGAGLDVQPPPPDLDLIRALLEEHGLRVSEVLRIDGAALAEPGVVVVPPSKGSDARRIEDAQLHAGLVAALARSPVARALPYTYRDVYTTLDALGVGYLPAGATHRRVTHAGRARHIQQLAASGLSNAEVAAAVGLKSEAVVPLYLTQA